MLTVRVEVARSMGLFLHGLILGGRLIEPWVIREARGRLLRVNCDVASLVVVELLLLLSWLIDQRNVNSFARSSFTLS